MNISIYVSQAGHIVLAFEELLERKVSEVVLDLSTGHVCLNFEDKSECALHDDVLTYASTERFCALGFFEGGPQFLPIL